MSAEWAHLASIFERAIALQGAERARFLDEECGTDQELRDEVESLLAHDDGTDDYLKPLHVPAVQLAAPLVEGQTIGGFRLVRRLGSGGMGSVYEAEQAHPHRRIALKVLPALEHDPAVQRRFAQESELLARMNHPAIAHIFATGAEGTTPFFAMELVDGALTIVEYTSRHQLNVTRSIELFRQVCAAIAHGHSKGVVHRDIKPGNLLVDVHGAPKVIDFGIARALDVAEGEAARMTRTGDLVGTLQYMSPEQAEGRVGDVDAQTDVHALGLVLYEMMCGRRAYVIEDKPLTQALRAISQDEIPRARAVRSDLPAEVEWILAKALEKDRARRYASVNELDADLERFLAHETVLAGPPSRIYEARKFARRHRVGIAALAAVFAALTIGLVVALRERNRATEARDQLAARAKELEIQTKRKDRILSFQKRLLGSARPDAEGRDVRVVDLLDLARSDLAEQEEEPEVAFELHASLGDAYWEMGRRHEGLAELRTALGLARVAKEVPPERMAELERFVVHDRAMLDADADIDTDVRAHLARCIDRFGPDGLETIYARLILAERLRAVGALGRAEESARSALAACTPLNDPTGYAADWARGELAANLAERGELVEAETLQRAIVADCRTRLGPENLRTRDAEGQLIELLRLQGNAVEIEQLARSRAEILSRRAGIDHPRTLSAEVILCGALFDLGRRDEGVRLLDEVRASFARVADPDEPDCLELRRNIAEILGRSGRGAEALSMLKDVRAKYVATGTVDSIDALRTTTSLATALLRSGDYAEAESMAREAALDGEARLGRENRTVISAWHVLAEVFEKTRRIEEAVEIYAANAAIQRRVLGPDQDDTLSSTQLLARDLGLMHRTAEAELAIREVLAVRYAKFGADHPRTLHAREILANILRASGRNEEAEIELCAITTARDPDDMDAQNLVNWTTELAGTRLALGRNLDAFDAFHEAFAIALRALPVESSTRLDATLNFAAQLHHAGRHAYVADVLEPIQDACLASSGPSGSRAKACRMFLLDAYDELGRKADATALRARMAAESKVTKGQ